MKADIELTIHDRLVLLGLLPSEADFITLRIVRDLRRELSFTEEELTASGLKQENGTVTWDGACGIVKTISFGDKAQALIRESLERLSKEKKATDEHLRVFDLFGGDEE